MGHASNKDLYIKKPLKKKKEKKILTGVCLVVAVGLTQDLKLILSTKKHQRKQNPSKNSSTIKESGEEFIVKNICCVLLPATTSLKMPCHGEDTLCLMVRFFHVVEIVSTTCDGVLITSQLVVTTRDS